MRDNNRKAVKMPDHLDYNKLRELGMTYLQSVRHSVWTDFNLHDPGVTTFELLCYALMDLGYRTSFEMGDLLATEDSAAPKTDGVFYQAHEILSSNPTTVQDYRKLILEQVPGVRNVWLEPARKNVSINNVDGLTNQMIQVKGFYRVMVDLESEDILKKSDYHRQVVGRDAEGRYIVGFEKKYQSAYRDYIVNLFHKTRNLCEFVEKSDVSFTRHIDVGLCARIETERDVPAIDILNEINRRVGEYVCPSIRLHSLEEMLRKGKTPDQIFQGPLPRYGFIDTDELAAYEKRSTLYVSDILNLIMGVEGVKSVSHLHFVVGPKDFDLVDYNTDFKLALKDDRNYSFSFQSWPAFVERKDYPRDEIVRTRPGSLSDISFVVNGVPFSVSSDFRLYSLKNKYYAYRTEREEVADFTPVLPLPEGNYRHTDHYVSIQDLFPKIYRLGKDGIDERASDLDKAERLQFKAYLILFEQILADYITQLSSLGRLFSWNKEGDRYDFSYFHKVLSEEEIKDLSMVLKSYQGYQGTVYPKEVTKKRRNRFLNHLLARFNEEFVDYSVFHYWNKQSSISPDFSLDQAIHDKKSFLKHYVEFSSRRANSADITEPWSYSPIERRIMSKLGIDNPPVLLAPPVVDSGQGFFVFQDNTRSSYNSAFGIHILEHLLMPLYQDYDSGGTGGPYWKLNDLTFLRLTKDKWGEQLVADPYSMQVTVVVPGWLDICQKEYFRIVVEKIVREEIPAHISAKVCWVDPYVMLRVEQLYAPHLEFLEANTFELQDVRRNSVLPELNEVMQSIHNIYPPSKLGKSDFGTITRLDYTALGAESGLRRGDRWEFDNNNKQK